MTLNEFYALLAKVTKERGLKWINGCYGLRCFYGWGRDIESCCPISACDPLAIRRVKDYAIAAEFIGLSDDDVIAISKASDNRDDHDPAIRRRLLEACGIRE